MSTAFETTRAHYLLRVGAELVQCTSSDVASRFFGLRRLNQGSKCKEFLTQRTPRRDDWNKYQCTVSHLAASPNIGAKLKVGWKLFSRGSRGCYAFAKQQAAGRRNVQIGFDLIQHSVVAFGTGFVQR